MSPRPEPAAHPPPLLLPGPDSPPLSSERVLERAPENASAPVWRTTDQPSAQPGVQSGSGWAGALKPGRTTLAREGPDTPAERIRRAVGAPLAVGVALFVTAVVIAIVVVMLRSEAAQVPEAAAHAIPDSGGQAQPGATSSGAGEASAAGTPAADATVIVHVAGAVHAPGIVELPAGSRVVDAVEEAGGASEDAALGGVNLARLAVDGEQIVVPGTAEVGADASLLEPPGSGPAPAGVGAQAPGMLSLSTATAAELETLPRVGPALAERIIEWRSEYGPFTSVEAVTDVPGIGEKTLDGFRDRVTP